MGITFATLKGLGTIPYVREALKIISRGLEITLQSILVFSQVCYKAA